MSAFLSLHTTATKTRVKKKEIRMIWHGVRINSQQDLQRKRGKKRKEKKLSDALLQLEPL